jgi:signal transduction histidine kinase
MGVKQMTDLIDSLLEFARTRESLTPSYSNISETVHRAVQAVMLHPRHQGTRIEVETTGQSLAWFDPRKLERALYNLLLNACEATPNTDGLVRVTVENTATSLTIAVADNGPGIAEPIRDKLFHPFVSHGKENGTGLGLTVVQKIVQDHGGEIVMERTAENETVFRITIPGRSSAGSGPNSKRGSEPRSDKDSEDKHAAGELVALKNGRAVEKSLRHSDG